MTEPLFTPLSPARADPLSAVAFLAGRDGEAVPPDGRPWVMVNFVTSLDGASVADGRSAPLSDPGDRAMFHALRAEADAIMAGTGTLAVERYRPAGKPVATVTRSGRLPREIPLFADPAGRAIVFSALPCDVDGVAADVKVEPLEDLAGALRSLHRDHGVDRLLCEGGPHLFGALLRGGLVDELFLTLAPKLIGGASLLGLVAGDPPPQLIGAQLASVLHCEGTLYLRYLL